ncbi:MAG: HEAT repeat domain-containing protein [Anaerolineae bacterium]|nr:HEAT repeat domain-containing protein [Anaerolineae bacterium]
MKLHDLKCPNCGTPIDRDASLRQLIECTGCGSTLLATDLGLDAVNTCPGCGTLNAEDQRFCTECGSALYIDCVLCHQKNKIDAIHCQRCGVNLKRNQLRRRQMLQDRKQLRDERNQIFKEKVVRQQAEKLQRLLDDLDEPENHEFAIYQINQIGINAVDALIETLLHDEDPDARYGSARALGQICQEQGVKGLIKARSAKALIQALNDAEIGVRYWAADALGKCGSRIAVEPLAKLLHGEKHEGVRYQARESLEQIGGRRAQQVLSNLPKSNRFLGWMKK